MKKFNARDVYHFICRQPGGSDPKEIMDNFAMERAAVVKIHNLLDRLGLIKLKVVPSNCGRVLTRTEIDQLEKFTGE
jgi:hypothetical protein